LQRLNFTKAQGNVSWQIFAASTLKNNNKVLEEIFK